MYSIHFLRTRLSYGCPSFALALVKALPVHTGARKSRHKPSALNSVYLRVELDILSIQLMPVVPLAGAQPHSAFPAECFHSHGSAGGMEHAKLPSSGIRESGRKAMTMRC